VTSRAYASRWLSVLGLGIALGVATAWVDVLAGGLDQTDGARALSMVLNAGAVWAGLAVLCGWIVRRPIVAAAIAGALGLGAAVLGYYLYGALIGDRVAVGLPGLTGAIRLWAVLAVTLGPVLGITGALIHRPGPIGILATLAVPVGVAVEMIWLRRLSGETFVVDPALAWAQAAMVATAIVGAVTVLCRRFIDTRRNDITDIAPPGEPAT
jgi:hypothetical protein